MSKFRNWYIRNQDAITWFIIGWCAFSSLDSLIKGEYIWAAIMALLAYGNYKLDKIKMQ